MNVVRDPRRPDETNDGTWPAGDNTPTGDELQEHPRHAGHAIFITAIHGKQKVLLTWDCQREGELVTTTCMPLDYGPRRSDPNELSRYHFWHEGGSHPFGVRVEKILAIAPFEESFDPDDEFPWWREVDWFVDRNWDSDR